MELDKVTLSLSINSMLTFSRYYYLILMIVIQASWANFTHSYEQGSYFVFDIIESVKVEPSKGRIAIPAKALAKAKAQREATEKAGRSEFEIDFEQTIQPKTEDSPFKSDPSTKTKPLIKTTSFQSEAFDFGNSDSVFGK